MMNDDDSMCQWICCNTSTMELFCVVMQQLGENSWLLSHTSHKKLQLNQQSSKLIEHQGAGAKW